MICELYDQGMSISEISRRLHIDRKNARKYAKSKEFPRCHEKGFLTTIPLECYRESRRSGRLLS